MDEERYSTWLALVGGLCAPLAALGWASPASALPEPGLDLHGRRRPTHPLFGQDVTYTATLTTSDLGSLDPSDTIEFQDNGNDIVNCNSQALLNTAPRYVHGDLCRAQQLPLNRRPHHYGDLPR